MTKMAGKGTLLQAEINNAYTTIVQRVEISGPSLETRTTETTDLDSTKAEYKPTISDAGEISCTAYYDPNSVTHDYLYDLWETPDVVDWKLCFASPSTATATFSGILTGLEISGMTVDDFVQVSISIKITGDVTLAGVS
jgi:hypothetical protein